MKIRTEYICPPIPLRQFDWTAIDDDTYDGAEDSRNRNQIGYGATEEAAIVDLLQQLEEPAAAERAYTLDANYGPLDENGPAF